MADKRRHKAFVVTDDETWIAFRAVCMVRQVTIEHALGKLVERIVSSPAPMEGRAVIAATNAAQLAESDRRAGSPPAKRKPATKSNTRSRRPPRKG